MNWQDYFSLGAHVNGAIKSVAETVKAIRDARAIKQPDGEKVIDIAIETLRDKVMELQQKQLELQSIALTLSQENAALFDAHRLMTEELRRFNKFEAEREEFKLVSFALNTSAYCHQSSGDRAEEQPLLWAKQENLSELQRAYDAYQAPDLHGVRNQRAYTARRWPGCQDRQG